MRALPNPTRLLMADGLRDGGSYFVIFMGSDEVRYSMHLPVQLDGDMKRTGYGLPTLSPDGPTPAGALSWAEAHVLAERLRGLGADFPAAVDAMRLGECLAVIERDGALA